MKFVAKPFYTLRELTQLFNAYEEAAAANAPRGYQRRIWNRWKTRRLLESRGLLSWRSEGQGTLRVITLAELRARWPDLVDSMILVDAIEAAAA